FFAGRLEPPASPQFGIATSTRSAQGRIQRFSFRRPNSSLRAWSRAADAIAYRHPFAKTSIAFRSVIGIAYKILIQNRHSKTLVAPLLPKIFLIRRPNSSPGAGSRAADAIAYGHPFPQTSISFSSVIGIAYKTPIRNRHSETLIAPLLPQAIRRRFRVEKPSFRTPKLLFQLTISPFQRCSHSNVSLDHMNLGRGGHTESASHSDRKFCSTRRKNSCSHSNVSLDHVNLGRGGHTESASHGDRKFCSTRRKNSSLVRRYGCTNIADIIILTPSGRELAITFRPGIRITYVSTIRNRHSKTVDRTLVSQNSVSRPKFHLGACALVRQLSYPLGKTQIFFRWAIGTARKSPIRNRHFELVGTRSDLEIFGPAPKFLSKSMVVGCR
ncbi:hypothetical protein Taro_027444, partial [Colocasia esculenta]|nr:hypothetical protein [Colocasia esculenta]